MQRPVHRLARGALVALLAALLLVCAGATGAATATPLGSGLAGPTASSAAGPAPSSGQAAASRHQSLRQSLRQSLHQDHVPAPRAGFAHQPGLHQAPRLHHAGAAEPVTAVRVRLLQSIDTAGARAGAGPPAPYTHSSGSRAPPA